FSNLKATLQVSLVNGRTYDFVFWADNGSSSPYTFDAADAEDDIKVDMTFSEAGNEGLDAFYGSVTKKIEGPTTVSATLTRPFAQINLGTDDLNSKAVQTAYGTNFTASVQTSSYMSMNPMTGAVIGELQTVNFDAIAAPSGEAFPVSGYDYLSMIYILADPAQDVVDVNYTIYNDGAEMMTLPVSNVPVQRNYRTNIYGSVLTSPANLQIDINPDFETPDNDVELKTVPKWDGTETPVTPENGQWVANTPGEFAYILNNIKQSDYYKPGTVISVNSDIDFTGTDWTPVRLRANLDTGSSLTFDFNGHTMQGLNAAFFDQFEGTIKNVTFKGCTINTTTNTNGFVGVVACNFYGTASNITVENCTITCDKVNRSVGGIFGQYSSGNATDCSVKNVTINNAQGYKAGGLFGSVNNDGSTVRTFTNCTATDVTITDYTGDYGGALIGRVYGCQLTLTGCSQTNCDPSAIYGGTAGSGVSVTEN
ncbi:MAG: hypothetical protein K2M87_07380, partial [Muribaculaceae bacterium]|nr:hypothetical protein [Muribaculaceae bacterium]